MKATAFISHFDCSRHDTGWNHADHQGRLPALMRAVHADMLTLFDPMLEVEGRHASDYELGLLHTGEYLKRVQGWVANAAARDETIEPVDGVRVSGASWAASTAAVGCTLTGIATVLAGEARNAFCAIRPPGRYVTADEPGGFGLLNTVAIPALHLVRERRIAPVLVVELGGDRGSPTADLLAGSGAHVAGVYRGGLTPTVPPPGSPLEISLAPGSGGPAFHQALETLLESAGELEPAFVVLSVSFDGLAGDPLGDLDLTPGDYYRATLRLREFAEVMCDGRLVSILDGGYDATALGSGTVQHLRALAGLDPVA